MKSYSAYFVRTDKRDEVQRILGRVDVVADSPWLVAGYDRSAGPPRDDVLWGRASLTEEKSHQLGEIIFLYADTSTDSFVYEHARDGTMLRKLVWFPLLDDDWTPGWLCAVGEREAWETRFFRPDNLAQVIEEERASCEERGDSALFPAREAEIRRVWNEHLIAAGSTIPSCDGTAALLVEDHFGLKRPDQSR